MGKYQNFKSIFNCIGVVIAWVDIYKYVSNKIYALIVF